MKKILISIIILLGLPWYIFSQNQLSLPDVPGFKTLKCDFHMHTVFSDGHVWPDFRVREALRDGLDAISITEHVDYKLDPSKVPTDLNVSYEIASEYAKNKNILIIKGAEISPRVPPYHNNALFLKDANLSFDYMKINAKEFIMKEQPTHSQLMKPFNEANEQGAFIFFNHPGNMPAWVIRDTAIFTDFHKELLKKKMLSGIEVVNSGVYNVTAHRLAMKYQLTMLCNTDEHWDMYPRYQSTHRPMTLVFARDKTIDAIKEALISKRMEYFANYNVKFSDRYITGLKTLIEKLPAEIEELEHKVNKMSPTAEHFVKINNELSKKKEKLIHAQKEILIWKKENFNQLSKFKQNLFEKAFLNNAEDPDFRNLTELKANGPEAGATLRIPKGDILYKFRKDVNDGKLPLVSWVVAPENFSDHPNAPWYGAWYVSEVLDILTQNPKVWKKTIFILTYDENDGYFDHIPPFTPPDLNIKNTGKCSTNITTDQEFSDREAELKDGVKKEDARSGPAGLGYRVPMIIASPWTKGGRVCSQVFDHTSSLQFLEKFLAHKLGRSIHEPNISQWHRAISGDLTSAFTVFNKAENNIQFLDKEAHIEGINRAKFKSVPTGFQKLSKDEVINAKQTGSLEMFIPKQEAGIKPACGLPYELYADGKPGNSRENFIITMKAGNSLFKNKSAGAPFKVYASNLLINEKNDESINARDYAVNAGDSLSDSWPINLFKNNNYHLRLYGPNGFFREFKGDDSSPQLAVSFNENNLPVLKIVKLNVDKNYQISIQYHGYNNSSIIRKTITSNQKEPVEIVINTKKSYDWYDFTLRVDGNENYSIRYAGHLENGEISFTDPVMGKLITNL